MSASTRHFASDYAAARRGFLAAAEAAGARIAGRPLAVRGAAGEELSVDSAYLGPEQPRRLLAVSSGIHGVEGFAGSALQHQLLTEQLPGLALPPDAGLLVVHALNPFGFSALRRVNESNVDLNRNFLRHPEEHVENPGYEALYDAINPEALGPEPDERARAVLLRWAEQHGFPALQAALTAGQYRHAHGVQFGGARDEASNAALRAIVREEGRGARHVVWIDVHTGLGAFGEVEMIGEMPKDDPAYVRGRAWYGERARSTVAGESVSAQLHGVMERGLAESLGPEAGLTAFAAEFGTYDPIRVFWAMRADNWLHRHGDPESQQGRAIKRELLEVFRPDARAWEDLVLRRGAAILRQARDGLASL